MRFRELTIFSSPRAQIDAALTFGIDVPSFLFADASGKECGTGTDEAPQNAAQVLEQRLFGTTILKECEVDYNRGELNRNCCLRVFLVICVLIFYSGCPPTGSGFAPKSR